MKRAARHLPPCDMGPAMTEDEWDAFWREGRDDELIYYAQRGDVAPLVEHLEQGGEVSPKLRAFFIAHLRGEIRRGRGGTPVKAQRDREAGIANAVWMAAYLGEKTLYAAQREYLDRNPDMNADTLKSICRRWGVTGKSVQKQ